MKEIRKAPANGKMEKSQEGWALRALSLQVLLPAFLGLLLLGAGGLALWQVDAARLSSSADASMIVLIIPLLCAGIFPMAVITALIVALVRAIGWLPGPLRRGAKLAGQASNYVERGSTWIVRPVIMLAGAWAVLATIWRGLLAFFTRGKGESNE